MCSMPLPVNSANQEKHIYTYLFSIRLSIHPSLYHWTSNIHRSLGSGDALAYETSPDLKDYYLDRGRARQLSRWQHFSVSTVAGMSSSLRQGHLTPAFGDLKEGFQEDVLAWMLTDKQESAKRGGMVPLRIYEGHLGRGGRA